MKIGLLYNYNFTDLGINLKRLKEIRETGFDAIDFNISNTDIEIYNTDKKGLDEILESIKTNVNESGLFISQIHGPWAWPPVNDSTENGRKERMDKMKFSIDISNALGVKYWVVHPIMPFGCDNVPADKYDENYSLNRAFFTELIKYAESKNVVICLENMPMPGFPISDPVTIFNFVSEFNSDNFKICLDTGHANLVKFGSLYDNITKLGDSIKVLHVHDNYGTSDNHNALYDGSINWQEFIKGLRDINYSGVFSLETKIKSEAGTEEYIKDLNSLYASAYKLINN